MMDLNVKLNNKISFELNQNYFLYINKLLIDNRTNVLYIKNNYL